jgi:hypothetical protein
LMSRDEIDLRDSGNPDVFYTLRLSQRFLSFPNPRLRVAVLAVMASNRFLKVFHWARETANESVQSEISQLEEDLVFLKGENQRLRNALEIELKVKKSKMVPVPEQLPTIRPIANPPRYYRESSYDGIKPLPRRDEYSMTLPPLSTFPALKPKQEILYASEDLSSQLPLPRMNSAVESEKQSLRRPPPKTNVDNPDDSEQQIENEVPSVVERATQRVKDWFKDESVSGVVTEEVPNVVEQAKQRISEWFTTDQVSTSVPPCTFRTSRTIRQSSARRTYHI